MTAATSNYSVELPSDLEYIPALRQYVAEIARVEGFSKKFCFRTEIIVDELATNGVLYGSQELESALTLSARFEPDQMHISVQDQGGSRSNLDKLRRAVHPAKAAPEGKKGRGLVIVQMLSNEIKIDVGESGQTQVHVVKMRDPEDMGDSKEKVLHESDI